jgi:hypothetical protein
VEARFDRPIEVPIIGNGERPNVYLRKLALANRIDEEWVAGIPEIALPGVARIPPPQPGHYPDVKPNVGDGLWTYMQEIVAKHLPQWRMRPDVVQGVVLERIAWRDMRETVRYRTDLPYRNMRSIHREPGGRAGLSIVQDLSEYYTDAIFSGAYNAGQGKRYSVSAPIAEAFKEGSAYNIGESKVYRAAPDDSLRSKHKCEMARRQFMMWHGLPPWIVLWKSWYDPAVREGDLIMVDELEVVLRKMSFTRFTKGAEQKADFVGRLAEDVHVPGDGEDD